MRAAGAGVSIDDSVHPMITTVGKVWLDVTALFQRFRASGVSAMAQRCQLGL
jgi:hypothetical protein